MAKEEQHWAETAASLPAQIHLLLKIQSLPTKKKGSTGKYFVIYLDWNLLCNTWFYNHQNEVI